MVGIKKLTIGMIIKNESKNLERCLSAIKPVLDNVKSELVIVDTGSEDNSVEIAKKYTDRVYNYVWTNNFAAARNESLKYATGEWFMTVDADEFLDNADELIKFFNNGEYKNYDAASYVQRNFTEQNSENLYGDAFVLRMFKRGEGRVFKGSIHESVVTDDMCGLKMLSKTVFKHWGYCAEADDDKYMNKLLNYESLIKSEIEGEPTNTLRYLQLSEIYTSHGSINQAKRTQYQIKAIEALKKAAEVELGNAKCNGGLVCAIYKAEAKLLYTMEKYAILSEICEGYFRAKLKFSLGSIGSDLDMYFYRGIACFEKSEFKTSSELLIKYIQYYKEMETGKHATAELLSVENSTRHSAYFYFGISRLIKSLALCDEISKADGYLDEYLSAEDAMKPKYVFNRIDAELEVIDILGDESRISSLLKRCSACGKEISKYLVSKLETRFRKSSKKTEILKILSECDQLSEMYQNLAKLRYADITDTEIDWNCLEYFFSDNKYLDTFYGDVLYFAIKYGVNFDNIALSFNPDKITEYINNFTVDAKKAVEALYTRINEDMSECDVSACRIYIGLCREFMLDKDTDSNKRIDFFGRFASISFEYISLVLNMNNLDENTAYILPIDLREMYLSGFAFVELSDGNYATAGKYLAMITEFSPQFKLVDNVVYGMNVKDSICTLIKNGNVNPARELINQYIELYGSDEEIEELKKFV